MNEEIKIEKGIPFFAAETEKYSFDQMKVGDSFLIKDKQKISSVRRAISNKNYREKDKHFNARKCDNGLRVWITK